MIMLMPHFLYTLSTRLPLALHTQTPWTRLPGTQRFSTAAFPHMRHVSTMPSRSSIPASSHLRPVNSRSPILNRYTNPEDSEAMVLPSGDRRSVQFSDVVLKSDRPVLVEFVASWCGPCRLMAPAIDWLAQEYEDRITVVKIDHDVNPGLCNICFRRSKRRRDWAKRSKTDTAQKKSKAPGSFAEGFSNDINDVV